MARLAFALLAVLLLALESTMGANVPTCDEVLTDIAPCIPYLTKNETEPRTGCCQGVRNLDQYSSNNAARQTICQCLESMSPDYPQVDLSLVSGLPHTCGVNFELPSLTPSFDCSKI